MKLIEVVADPGDLDPGLLDHDDRGTQWIGGIYR